MVGSRDDHDSARILSTAWRGTRHVNSPRRSLSVPLAATRAPRRGSSRFSAPAAAPARPTRPRWRALSAAAFGRAGRTWTPTRRRFLRARFRVALLPDPARSPGVRCCSSMARSSPPHTETQRRGRYALDYTAGPVPPQPGTGCRVRPGWAAEKLVEFLYTKGEGAV